MGTRADFYVGRGVEAEWIGSIAWDGYPGGLKDTGIVKATTEAQWRELVAEMLKARDDGTTPDQGWPWPWENSHTTDYAYAFENGRVYGSCFGHKWFDARRREPEDHGDDKPTVFPDMKARQKVTLGKRSGVLIIGTNGPVLNLK